MRYILLPLLLFISMVLTSAVNWPESNENEPIRRKWNWMGADDEKSEISRNERQKSFLDIFDAEYPSLPRMGYEENRDFDRVVTRQPNFLSENKIIARRPSIVGRRNFLMDNQMESNNGSHIEKVLDILRSVNKQEDLEKRSFSASDGNLDIDTDLFDENDDIIEEKKREFVGTFIKAAVKAAGQFIKKIFKSTAKATTKAGSKALTAIKKRVGVKKASWKSTPANGKALPKVKSFIGDAAEVVLEESPGKLRTVLQYADTEEGPGILYNVENIMTKEVIESGFKKSDNNLVDTAIELANN